MQSAIWRVLRLCSENFNVAEVKCVVFINYFHVALHLLNISCERPNGIIRLLSRTPIVPDNKSKYRERR